MVRDRWEEHLHAYHVLLIFLKHLLKHISDFTMERFPVKSSFFQTCVQLQCWELLLETGCNYKDLWSDPPQLLSSFVLNCLPCNQDFVLWVCFRLKVKIIECCIQTTGLNSQEREPLPLPAHTGHIPSPSQVLHGKAARVHVFKLLTATPLQRTLSWCTATAAVTSTVTTRTSRKVSHRHPGGTAGQSQGWTGTKEHSSVLREGIFIFLF